MIAQLDATVARPEIAWDGLLPILTLGVGALLLVLFRSLMKQLKNQRSCRRRLPTRPCPSSVASP